MWDLGALSSLSTGDQAICVHESLQHRFLVGRPQFQVHARLSRQLPCKGQAIDLQITSLVTLTRQGQVPTGRSLGVAWRAASGCCFFGGGWCFSLHC